MILHTGNILSINDIIKKSGQNPSAELTEAVKITLKDFEDNGRQITYDDDDLLINRLNDDLDVKMKEEELTNLKIGIKIFLNNADKTLIYSAVKEAFKTLKVSQIHNVIIVKRDADINVLKNLWMVLEELVHSQKVQLIGIADIEETVFREIYEWANVKPKIIQINLATCCVVPPTLQSFCKDNDVQLLTHSDPVDMFPVDLIKESFKRELQIEWVLRYSVHVKCRGVLMTKGYIISLVQNGVAEA